VRGHSSRWFSKKSYRLKIVNAQDTQDKIKQQLMGMSAASEWALYGPFLDKTLMRNYMWMNLAGEIMPGWAMTLKISRIALPETASKRCAKCSDSAFILVTPFKKISGLSGRRRDRGTTSIQPASRPSDRCNRRTGFILRRKRIFLQMNSSGV